ncbi:MAG: tRNA glutamyl-Q(34) synthetase GluQRS [Akkermansiaceae bacterium]|nr:tRNA glutamyl-Q(34) synthetase GluQRS [Akkermansiaceae bacterium]
MRTRFAPSPTGYLHLGHAYSALVGHDLARSRGGSFLLRFEDIDHTRVRPEYYEAIESDLRWLGLDWDGEALRQTDRLPAYRRALEALRGRDLLYPCFCTRREIREEIARMAHAPHGPEGPHYPGTCRRLGAPERERRLAAGHDHCWRLAAGRAAELTGPLRFTDTRHGTIDVAPDLLGDVVLARRDIQTSYHLAVVVDDAYQEITDVTRGEDLLPSTHVHRILQELLGLPEPRYHHHRLLTGDDGERLAKRTEAPTLRDLRVAGESPAQVRALLDA